MTVSVHVFAGGKLAQADRSQSALLVPSPLLGPLIRHGVSAMSSFSNEADWQAGAHRTTASWQHASCYLAASVAELLSVSFADARSVELPRVSLSAQMRAMMTKMSNERLHTSWLLVPVLASMGCGSLWTPFLGTNPAGNESASSWAVPSGSSAGWTTWRPLRRTKS